MIQDQVATLFVATYFSKDSARMADELFYWPEDNTR